jgi:hypothetical protein
MNYSYFVMVGCEVFCRGLTRFFIFVLLVMAGGCKLLDKDANYIAEEQGVGKKL